MSALPPDVSSIDDYAPIRDRPRRLFQRYAHDLTLSLQSLDASNIIHDDLRTPSAPAHAIHATSTHSTPITSPSTGYSSLFAGSLSSPASESPPGAEYRSEFGLLTPRSSAYSPVLGSSSSRSSNPISPRSRSTTESDTYLPASRIPPKRSSRYPSQRPSTAPHSPAILPIPINPADTSAEHHTRSHSRLAASIKSFLSKPALASPSRFSFNSSITQSETEPSRSFHPAVTGKWPMTPRKSRPPNLEISGSAATAAMPSPIRSPNQPFDVHRRYASEAVAEIYNAKTGSGLPMSQDSLDLSAQNVTPGATREREPKTRNVLRRRPSGSAKLFKARERGMSSPSHPHERNVGHLDPLLRDTTSWSTDEPLTPAGAVVEAYKQQELFRDDKYNPPRPSTGDRMSRYSGYDREHLMHSPTPYDSTFRPLPEHRMRAGSDDRLSKPEVDPRARPMRQPFVSDSTNRHLTRKVSSKWRKTKGGVASEESPARDCGHSKGPSLQDMLGNDKSGTRATGYSMDAVLNTSNGAWPGPIEGRAGPGPEKRGPGGGKLWRMMRWISTGGLRDRFLTEKAVPPVPAIPKELLDKANWGEHSNEPVSTPPHQHSSSLRDKSHGTPPQNITSVAITTSSSNSSDAASIHFFHKTHSARSSVSSYGEAAAHSKEISLHRHIIAPLEQLRLGEDHAGSDKPGGVPRSPRRTVSVPVTLRKMEGVEDEDVALPSPRRQTTSGDSSSPASSRPASTAVSGPGSAPVSRLSGHGLGGRQSQTADGLVSLSPPPRPARSSRRGGSTARSTSPSLLVSQVDGLGGARQLDRTLSGQSDTTARPVTPEPRVSRDQEPRTHLTYRELGGPRRPPLSEREKVDIWNELLDRSDRAGGTLHIGGAAELMSDNLRFSMHSEI